MITFIEERWTNLLVLILLGVVSSFRAEAAAMYSVTPLPSSFLPTGFGALNDSGQIAGSSPMTSTTPNHAELYSNGVVTNLIPGAAYSQASGINNAGQVVGLFNSGGSSHAFLYSNGTLTDLTAQFPNAAEAIAINDAGQILIGGSAGAFLVGAGSVVSLGNTLALNGLNGTGQVVGLDTTNQHGFVYSDGKLIDVGTLGGSQSDTVAINNAGEAVGYSLAAGDSSTHAFLYKGGVLTDIGGFGGTFSFATGINDSGQIVGHSTLPGASPQMPHAFLYSDGILFDLNSLIDPSLNITLSMAFAINNPGQIVAMSEIGRTICSHPLRLSALFPSRLVSFYVSWDWRLWRLQRNRGTGFG